MTGSRWLALAVVVGACGSRAERRMPPAPDPRLDRVFREVMTAAVAAADKAVELDRARRAREADRAAGQLALMDLDPDGDLVGSMVGTYGDDDVDFAAALAAPKVLVIDRIARGDFPAGEIDQQADNIRDVVASCLIDLDDDDLGPTASLITIALAWDDYGDVDVDVTTRLPGIADCIEDEIDTVDADDGARFRAVVSVTPP